MSDERLVDRLQIDAREKVSGRRFAPVAIAIVLVGGLGAALWAWLVTDRAVAVEIVRPVMIEAGGKRARASVLDASGYVVARRQATVAAEVTGKLVEVGVEEGQAVERGQVLARIDDATEQAQLALARARLEAARSTLAETVAQLENARRTLVRQRELRARELTSQSDVDLAETEVVALDARLANQRDQIRVAQREVAVQRQRIEELTVRAPFSGVVIARAAQAGEMVSPISAGGGFTRTGICTIVDMESLEIEVDVNEAYIDRVFREQPVVARLDAYPDWEIPARVKAVVPAADRQKATVRVRIEFLELDPRILPEMGISVRFLESGPSRAEGSAARSRLPAVPAHAIVNRRGREYVYLLKDGRVELRAVRPGGQVGERIVIAAGLAGGEALVAGAADLDLEDGARVQVRNR